MCGICCTLESGSWEFKNTWPICQYLSDNGDGTFSCLFITKMRDEGLTEVQMIDLYGDEFWQTVINHNCHPENDFPLPEHFGYREETADFKWADGWDAHIDEVMSRWKTFKDDTSCSFDFEVVD